MGGDLQSVFISYGGPDQRFAERLHDELERRGVTAFLFSRDAEPGAKLHTVMHEGVNEFDRVILICSSTSLNRPGVLNEIEETLQREAREGGAAILIPITVDDYLFKDWAPSRPDIARAVRDRVVADFRNALHNDSVYAEVLERIIKALCARKGSHDKHPTIGKSDTETSLPRASDNAVTEAIDLDNHPLAKMLNIRARHFDGKRFHATAARIGISTLNFCPPSQIHFMGAADGAFTVLLDIRYKDPKLFQAFAAVLPLKFLEPLLVADERRERAELRNIDGVFRFHVVSRKEGINALLIVEDALIDDGSSRASDE
jgi:TIR domain